MKKEILFLPRDSLRPITYHFVVAVERRKEAEYAARERLGDYDRNLAASVSVTRAG
jgi:hypothetical protein